MSNERQGSLQPVEPSPSEQAVRPSYTKPELFLVAPATQLLQGPMISATYRDCSNSGYSYDPQPC